MDFLTSHLIMNAPLGATANTPKTDDWKWSTEKSVFSKRTGGSRRDMFSTMSSICIFSIITSIEL